jgi:hypothetical protein
LPPLAPPFAPFATRVTSQVALLPPDIHAHLADLAPLLCAVSNGFTPVSRELAALAGAFAGQVMTPFPVVYGS